MLRCFLLTGILWVLFSQVAAQSLAGTRWELEGVDDIKTGRRHAIEGKIRSHLYFSSDTSFSGKLCNMFSGEMHCRDSNQVSFRIVQESFMICLGLQQFERELLSHLKTAKKMRRDHNTLFIFNENKRITYTLAKEVSAEVRRKEK